MTTVEIRAFGASDVDAVPGLNADRLAFWRALGGAQRREPDLLSIDLDAYPASS